MSTAISTAISIDVAVDSRSILDRHSVDTRSTVDRESTECRPSVDRLSTATSTDIAVDIAVDITYSKHDPFFSVVSSCIYIGVIFDSSSNVKTPRVRKPVYMLKSRSASFKKNPFHSAEKIPVLGPVYMEKSCPGQEGHPPSRVNFTERLYEKKVDPSARAKS